MASPAPDLTKIFFNHFLARYDLMVPNIFMQHGYEMDILAVRKSGFVDEIEIKCSRSDFLADFRKTVTVQDRTEFFCGRERPIWKAVSKHEAIQNGWLQANYFSFLMTPDLADECLSDVPEYAGVYTAIPAEPWSLRERKKPKRLHTNKISDALEKRVLKKMAYRYMNTIMGRGDG